MQNPQHLQNQHIPHKQQNIYNQFNQQNPQHAQNQHNPQNIQNPVKPRDSDRVSARPHMAPSAVQRTPVAAAESAPKQRPEPSLRRASSVTDECLHTARSDSSGRAQARARPSVEYKPITLDEFKEKYPEYRRKYVQLGRLGPDLASEELLQKVSLW
jgi:hypothetical protein